MTKRSALSQCLDQVEIDILVAVYGAGQFVYVPSSTAEAAHLEVLLGLSATSSLIGALGGNNIYLPGLPRPNGKERGPSLSTVKALSKKPSPGLSASAIARKFQVSIRTIYAKRREIIRRERLGIGLKMDPWRARMATKNRTPKNARARTRAVRASQKRDLEQLER